MNVRAVWRAVVLPFSVALVAIVALVWFNVVRIPAQEQYLNERNLRLLRTISAQIKSKVDNFDQAIDNALDSLDESSTTTPASFGEYVRLFAPEVEILQFSVDRQMSKDGSAVEKLVFNLANDPPRIKVQRDEGRNYLYLGYKHKGTTVVARADIERVVGDYLPVDNDFDALLMVGTDGRVIVQQSSSGIELARVDRLKPYPPPATAAAATGGSTEKKPADEPVGVFDTLRASSAVTRVSVGDVLYELYIQPVQLSLPSAIADPNKADVPEEWALCALVRSDHFRAASSAISYTAMLWFGVALTAFCVAIPLLKIHLLNARERLRRTDVALAAAMSFLAAALVSFAVLDVYQFGYVFPELTDRRLGHVADRLAARLKRDAELIDAQMREFQAPHVWATDLQYVNGQDNNLDGFRKRLVDSAAAKPTIYMFQGNKPICLPMWACRESVLGKMTVRRIVEMPYPYFDLNIFNDHAGEQRIKWTTSAVVTPFLNLNDANLAYFQDLKRARLLARTDHPVPQNGVSVFLSPNTGNRITVFWKALSANEMSASAKGNDLIGQSLSANPISLDSPVLPANLQFAVLARDGRVLFHSDPTRSLKENFIQELEESLPLKSKILEKRPGSLTAYYRARAHRLYVEPLDLGPFENPDWSLVVFQNSVVPETINLYTLTLASSMFALYACVLLGGSAVAFGLSRKEAMRWFWPDPDKGDRYRAVYILNGVLALAAIAGIYVLPAPAIVAFTAGAVITAIIGSHGILTRTVSSFRTHATWQRELLWARTSLLLILAVVPALVCFHVAYDFETRLFDQGERMRLTIDRKARDARIESRAPQAGLCGPDFARGRPCANLAALLTRRAGAEREWDDGLDPFFGKRPAASPASDGEFVEPGRLHMFLRLMHRPINDLGADLTAVAAGSGTTFAAAMGDAPNIGWLALIPLLLGALHVLSRSITEPLFALDLYRRKTFNGSASAGQLATNLLLIGPPGSGKTARLRSMPEVRTFDVRKLAFVERRKRSSTVKVDRRQTWQEPFSGAAAPDPSQWASSIDLGRSSHDGSTIVGIDHLESRIDDPLFRRQMLRVLEDLLFRYEVRVWVAIDREPLHRLGETAPDLDRWSRVFQPFRKQVIGISRESIPGRLHTLTDLMRDREVPESAQATIFDECALTPQLQAIGEDIVRQRSFPARISSVRSAMQPSRTTGRCGRPVQPTRSWR